MAMSNPEPIKPLKSWPFFFLILVALIALGLGEATKLKAPKSPFGTEANNPKDSNSGPIKQEVALNNVIFKLEVAKTNAERSLGLSFRNSLGPEEGMIFEFNPPEIPRFWMKDMYFAIDIIWVNQAGQIVALDRDLKPNSFPKLFSPPTPISHVIEVAADTASRLDLQVGDFIHFLNKK